MQKDKISKTFFEKNQFSTIEKTNHISEMLMN